MDVGDRYKGKVVLTKIFLCFHSNGSSSAFPTSIAHTMPIAGREKEAEQCKGELNRIARISPGIRRAVIAALPVPSEQFLTLNVPRKVLNCKVREIVGVRQRHSPSQSTSRTLSTAGTRTAAPRKVVPPPSVQLKEAILRITQ